MLIYRASSILHSLNYLRANPLAFNQLQTNGQFISQFQTAPSLNLITRITYNFTRRAKASQLILYSEQEIQKLHINTNANDKKQEKPWTVFKESNQKYKVSLVGLPNCGKSSLFNCLIGERLAIVDKEFGMTRDRREFTILNGMVSIIDTPGIQVGLLAKNVPLNNPFNQSPEQSTKQLKGDIFQQTLRAISESDLVLLILDSKKEALSQGQIILAKYLKAFNSANSTHRKCQIAIVCNKCDGVSWDENFLLNQIYSKLPIYEKKQKSSSQQQKDNIFFCSAEQGTGVFEILEHINQNIPYEMKERTEKVRKQRRQKFEKLVKKMKEEIKDINEKIDNSQKSKQQDDKAKKSKSSKAEDSGLKAQNPLPRKKDIKKFKIKDWEKDFRELNPNPEQNQELDNQNYEDLFLRPQQTFSSNQRGVDIKNLRMKHSLKICFIGRPNVGKSSLINQLLGQQKMVVSQVPHTTRDSLTTKIMYKNRKIQLIDTAGLNTPRISQNQEQYLRKSQISTMLHVQQAHVVVYVMDAFSAFKVDDFKLINRVIDEGRPVIIVVNKWQSIKEQYKNKARQFLMSQIQKNLGQLNGYPIVFVSAKMLLNIDQMMDKIVTTYDKWNKRISTGLLNNWLEKFKKLDNMPKDQQRTLKINYIIQARVRPPHFIMFVNNKQIFKGNYMRFLTRNIAEQFQLDGIPLRHTLRSTNNKENQVRKWKKTPHSNPKPVNKTTAKMQQLKKKYGDFSV